MPILQEDALLALFCSVDDFCEDFLPRLKACLLPDKKRRNRARSLSESEIITILIAFHQSQFLDALKASLAISKLNWKPGVLYFLASLVFALMGLCALGVGLFIFFPLALISRYVSYQIILNK